MEKKNKDRLIAAVVFMAILLLTVAMCTIFGSISLFVRESQPSETIDH